MHYVDGFVLPIPRDRLPAYRALAQRMGRVWIEHGALEYRECAGEDLDAPWAVPFPAGIRAREGETVVFAWITYRSRKDRDRVNAAVMKDPRVAALDPAGMPFDCARMLYGGFEVIAAADGPGREDE